MMGLLSEQEINELLSSQTFGHLGCCENGKPYVFPMAYAYHANILYGQTTAGKKVEILRRNPSVCFQVQDVTETHWRSVQCWGTFEELAFEKLDGTEAARIVRLLSEHLGSIQHQVGINVEFSGGGSPKPVLVNGKLTTLFRIVLDEKSGILRKDWKD